MTPFLKSLLKATLRKIFMYLKDLKKKKRYLSATSIACDPDHVDLIALFELEARAHRWLCRSNSTKLTLCMVRVCRRPCRGQEAPVFLICTLANVKL